MSDKKTITTIEDFEIWETDPDDPTIYRRNGLNGEYTVDVLTDHGRTFWKNLDHYRPDKLANCSHNYKIWASMNAVDAKQVLHRLETFYEPWFGKKGVWFFTIETPAEILRIRLSALKDALRTRLKHIKEAHAFRKQKVEAFLKEQKAEANLQQSVETLKHDLEWLYNMIHDQLIPHMIDVHDRKLARAKYKNARLISMEIHEIKPYNSLGLRSEASLATGETTPEHIFGRQFMARKIIELFLRYYEKGSKPPFGEFIQLVYKANEVVITTPDENGRLRKHQQCGTLEPHQYYELEGIKLVRVAPYQIQERWQVLAHMFDVELLPPHDFGVDPN